MDTPFVQELLHKLRGVIRGLVLGDLELAGLHAAAETECRRIIAATQDNDLRRRTKLHLAAALLGQGKLDAATKILDAIAPPPAAPAEGEAEPAPVAPRDFIGT